jgi:hypothetical protein
MSVETNNSNSFSYIETPRGASSLIKIDTILALRLKAFIKARKVRRFTFSK